MKVIKLKVFNSKNSINSYVDNKTLPVNYSFGGNSLQIKQNV